MADPIEADASALETVSPEGPLCRIARPPDPWLFPDWAHAGSDGTFGNRWDDPRDRSTPRGRRCFAGIAYRSRLGDEFRNWAIFESPGGALPWTRAPEVHPVEADDPDLVRALERLGVRLTAATAAPR